MMRLSASLVVASHLLAAALAGPAPLGFSARQGGGGPPPDGATDGGGGPPGATEPASDTCLTAAEWKGNNPSTIDGYGSCFKYTQNADGTADVYLSGIPDHLVVGDNRNELCSVPQKIVLPKPVKGDLNIQVPQVGAIAIAINGVYMFGPAEGDGGNAVSGSTGIIVGGDGHAQLSGIWHYHHPNVANRTWGESELVGYALDGFPIYGSLSGSKEDVDSVLDDCNGRDFDDSYGYRYHIRTREQVDETAATNIGADNVDNWNYYLGCYRGESSILQTGATSDTSVCPHGTNLSATPANSSSTASEESETENTATDSSSEDSDESEASSSQSGSCFPSDAWVLLECGRRVRMDELAEGDRVLVGQGKFSEVFMFTHQLADVSRQFLVVDTASGLSLSLTKEHYMYANGALTEAGNVSAGSIVTLGNGDTDTVVRVRKRSTTGLFNPQTMDGNIVVNGVLASTYTTAIEPTLAHAALAPFRILYKMGLPGAMLSFPRGAGPLEGSMGSGATLYHRSASN